MMTIDEIQAVVAEVMSQVLNMPVSPGNSIAMNTCTAWDSLKHIEIIITMEERFGIYFDVTSLPELNSQDIFVEHIRRLLHQAKNTD